MQDDTNVETNSELGTDDQAQQTETVAPKKKRAPKRVGKAAKRAAEKETRQPVVLRKGQVLLKTILAELDLPPDGKLARRKLRAAKFDWHGHNERWIFNAKQAQKVKEILGGE